MKFTANYSNLIKTYRLKKFETWKQIIDETILYEDDMAFDSPILAKQKIATFTEIKIENTVINPNSEVHILGDYLPEILTHRISKPQYLLTREDLKRVLLNGDDRCLNVLVIDFDGRPKLIPLLNGEAPLTISYYPVRNESFMPGNGYVGNEKSIEDIDALYTTLLLNWLVHLQTGKSQFVDLYENADEEVILKQIESINSKF